MKDYIVAVKWSDYRRDTFFFDDLNTAINERNIFREDNGESDVYVKIEKVEETKSD